MSKNIDELLYEVLKEEEAPSLRLNRQILRKACLEGNNMNMRKVNRVAAAAIALSIAMVGTVTTYATYRYLHPSQIASQVSDNNALAKAFESEDAIEVNETQRSNGYEITLLGIVTGRGLEPYIPKEKIEEIQPEYTYAAFSIRKIDGSAIENRNFCIAPLIGGVPFMEGNAATLDVFSTCFVQDGILYELVQCDNLQIFADRGVWMSVVDFFGEERAAFQMDAATGAYSKVENYDGTSALFRLPLDGSKADKSAAEAYLDTIRKKAKDEAKEGRNGNTEFINEKDKIDDFLKTITAENIDQYFTRDENTVFTAKPDANNWIDFGSRYVKEEDMTYYGISGYLEYLIPDGEDFAITSISTSEGGDNSGTTLYIDVIFRNNDGSFTEAIYTSKKSLEELVK